MLASLFRLHFGVFLALCFQVSLLQLCVLSFKVIFRWSFYLLALQCLDMSVSKSTAAMLKPWQSCIVGLPGFLLRPFLLESGHLFKHREKLPIRMSSCKKLSSAEVLDVAPNGFWQLPGSLTSTCTQICVGKKLLFKGLWFSQFEVWLKGRFPSAVRKKRTFV